MSKNKISIDLRRTPLTPEQTKVLHNSLHETLVSHIANSLSAPAALATTAAGPQPATLTVTITGANPGLSNINAKLNGTTKTLTQSGKINFAQVNSGDIIAIDGQTLGATTITIDVSADPASMSFPPGEINGNFFIN